MANSYMTISEYWQSHGYTKAEADRMEREQIKEAERQADREDLYEAGIWNMF